MRPVVTDGLAWSVCLSVCLSVTIVSPAKTAEPIEMPFGMWTKMGPRKHVLDGVQIATRDLEIFRVKRVSPEHARACPAVDILKATRQGAAPVRCGCRLGCTR